MANIGSQNSPLTTFTSGNMENYNGGTIYVDGTTFTLSNCGVYGNAVPIAAVSDLVNITNEAFGAGQTFNLRISRASASSNTGSFILRGLQGVTISFNVVFVIATAAGTAADPKTAVTAFNDFKYVRTGDKYEVHIYKGCPVNINLTGFIEDFEDIFYVEYKSGPNWVAVHNTTTYNGVTITSGSPYTISGVPTGGPITFRIMLINVEVEEQYYSSEFTIYVNSLNATINAPLGQALNWNCYTLDMELSTCTKSGGSLPPGITISYTPSSTDYWFVGTPTVEGTYYATVSCEGINIDEFFEESWYEYYKFIVSPSSGPKINVKVNGAWKEGKPYVKVNGVWKEATKVYIKVNGVWKEST